MAAKKRVHYKSIDKRFLTEGSRLDFSVYGSNPEKTMMYSFLLKGRLIDGSTKVHLLSAGSLFITEDEHEQYKLHVQKHLYTIANSPDIPFAEKIGIVYERASEAMDELFRNPDALGNMQKSQAIVDGFVSLSLQNEATLSSIMKIAAHDYYTHTHSINVSIYSLSMAKFLGFSDKDLNDMGMSSMLHDLGKSRVEWEIINKNGKLDEAEFEQMKKHPAAGYEIALEMGITDKRILSGIRSHHEKLDGSGYPDGLSGKEISEFARIIGVCDVFDALTTKRSYKAAMSSFEAIKIMKEKMSFHLDMKLVNTLIRMCSV